ncbi:MAG TPA: hypothetical protein VMH02_03105 [Verrucomicrobiae bacterium]|nr:hypothetical protein [Verrucomicrobiae bacterium]
MSDLEQIPLSEELLAVMRSSGRYAQQLREPFITSRALLLALLDDPAIGAALGELVPREKLMELESSGDVRNTAARLPEAGLPPGERGALPRFDTLAFKLPEGTASVWLSRESYAIFVEGANRAEGRYLPKHLAFGLAAEAVRSPGILRSLRVEPGKVTDAIYGLE